MKRITQLKTRVALTIASMRQDLSGPVHMYTYMATKTISITKEAYDRLKMRKESGESFSDVIVRLTERKALSDFAGILAPSSVKALSEAIAEVRRERKTGDVRA